MGSNTFGTMFRITSFGESHGVALGVVVDGVPPRLKVDMEDLKAQLARRAPGQQDYTTSRKEADDPEILSGVFEGQTTGHPICVIIRNTSQRSQDYNKLKSEHRKGHADKTMEMKYGIRDHRGGGRSSGRETVARVIGGYFAQLTYPQMNVVGSITQLGPFPLPGNPKNINETGVMGLADPTQEATVADFLMGVKKRGESVGGIVRVCARDIMPGLGAPVFDKLKADLAKALMSIGAVVSFELGEGKKLCKYDRWRLSKFE